MTLTVSVDSRLLGGNSPPMSLPLKALIYYGIPGENSTPPINTHIVHYDVVSAPGVPARLGVGRLLDERGVKELATMAREMLANDFRLLPPNALYADDSTVVWTTPPGRRLCRFSIFTHQLDGLELSEKARRVLSGGNFVMPVPQLVWILTGKNQKKLSVIATRQTHRPTAQEKMCHAPFGNMYYGGGICWGSGERPADEEDPSGWVDKFFASKFTQFNHVQTISGGWSTVARMIDDDAQVFDPQWLVDSNLTLAHAIQQAKGQ